MDSDRWASGVCENQCEGKEDPISDSLKISPEQLERVGNPGLSFEKNRVI